MFHSVKVLFVLVSRAVYIFAVFFFKLTDVLCDVSRKLSDILCDVSRKLSDILCDVSRKISKIVLELVNF